MSENRLPGWRSALGWLFLPLVPCVLGRTYYEVCNLNLGAASKNGPDPWDWSWGTWTLLIGPLIGYGFLAGATLRLPDEPGRRGLRSWLFRRAVWMTVGPWSGWLVGMALLFLLGYVGTLIDRVLPRARTWLDKSSPSWWPGSWMEWLFSWIASIAFVGVLGYGWLFAALAAIRRARRIGNARRAIQRGLATAIAFVGSLFGSFWAITEAWRSYFFDTTVIPLLLATATLTLMSGCAATLTYGEVRRRDLFAAMLTAWLLGLAFAWRWWSRKR